jgi:EAL domain-containing protein (putative c-di-GMP-specific phosphodiesterase class I)
MQDATNKRHWIEVELGNAIENRCLAVHYQPIVELESMNVVGAEALMRWNHPASGLIAPDVFIPVAEQTGMISTLSKWVFDTALAEWSQWCSERKAPMNLAFNLSAAQFVMQSHVADLLELVEGYIRTSGCLVTVEITESLKLVESAEYLEVLKKFHDIGCRIAIDDFGTGYSSLSYLKRLPIDIVKIDKSFVRDIATEPSDAATVRAILQMADALNLEVVAEGVETKEQLDFLRKHGCHFAQGFFFSKPAPLADLKTFFKSWTGACQSGDVHQRQPLRRAKILSRSS